MKRTNVQEIVKDYLTKTKEEFKKQLEDRIKMGDALLSRSISSNEELGKLEEDFSFWDNYNEELLKQSFNNPNNNYYKEYTSMPMVIYSDFVGNSYLPSLQERVNDSHRDVLKYLNRLRKIYEKVELMELSPGMNPIIFEESSDIKALLILGNLFTKFHKVAQTIRQRHNKRDTILISDEYDVQDLLRGLLKINFDDIREEDYVPSYAGSNSRVDFVLKNEKIVVETKITSEKLTDKEIGNQLLIDIGRYRSHPESNTLAVFVYDKGDYIINKAGLTNDLEKMTTPELKVKIFIEPK